MFAGLSDMGTGITSILLHNLPYQFTGLHEIATAIFVLNIILFLAFTTATLVRFAVWRNVFLTMLYHPQQSLFVGTFAMGGATIVNMIVFMMFTRHKNELPSIAGIWILPVVAPNVASASGGIVASALPPAHARLTVIVSYCLWGMSVPVALMVMTLMFLRFALHRVPPAEAIISVVLPLGACGQGAFALLQLASVGRQLARETGTWLASPGTLTSEESNLIASAIYGGSIWVLGTVQSVTVLLLWLYVGLVTLYKAIEGSIFVAPCLGPTGEPPKEVPTKQPLK
ncbi:sulfite efflux pump SSU1 [Pseudohyphozyma bogoriensis]|nr:sulfite efflux pump SSU1 [Pseudohyphozyma bogoriensis]